MKKAIDYIILCERCQCAICSRGEKIVRFDTLEWIEDFDEQDTAVCEWCENEYEKSELTQCAYR